MKPRLVFDASAVAKWFLREEESEEAKELRDLYLKGKLEIFVPRQIFLELANALRYTRGLSPKDVMDAIEALMALRLNVVEDEDVLKEAIKTAFERDITVYDALYIALARKLDSKLITYDKELLSNFKNVAMKAKEALVEIKEG